MGLVGWYRGAGLCCIGQSSKGLCCVEDLGLYWGGLEGDGGGEVIIVVGVERGLVLYCIGYSS